MIQLDYPFPKKECKRSAAETSAIGAMERREAAVPIK